MAEQKTDLLTPGNIAKELKVSDSKVKKAKQDLGLTPAAKKGICSYYSKKDLTKIKSAIK